jgi:hypothetical protein
VRDEIRKVTWKLGLVDLYSLISQVYGSINSLGFNFKCKEDLLEGL